MILFEGRYQWDGKKRGTEFPVSWWPGSYQIKIIDLKAKFPGVILLKPYLCIFSSEDTEYSVRDKFHNLAVKISRDFNLDPEKVMWIEKGSGRVTELTEVAVVEAMTRIGNEKIFKTIWHEIRPNEISFIRQAVVN